MKPTFNILFTAFEMDCIFPQTYAIKMKADRLGMHTLILHPNVGECNAVNYWLVESV